MRKRNPYRPGAARQPPEMAGREAESAQFRDLLDYMEEGGAERGIILTGLRGVGKTVLLEEMRRMADERGWVYAFVEAGLQSSFRLSVTWSLTESLRVTSLRHRTSARLREALRVFKSFSLKSLPDGSVSFGIELEALAGRADTGNLEMDLSELLTDLGGTAVGLGVGVLLIVDELQDLPLADITAVAGAVHQTNRMELPVAVVGAGLPNLPAVLTEAKPYAERLFDYRSIGALGAEDAGRALRLPAESRGVVWEEEALAYVVEASAGYPFFLQTFGSKVWECAPGPDDLTLADAEAGVAAGRRGLEQGFYRSRWERATPAQREYLTAMAIAGQDDQPVSTRGVVEYLDKTHSDASPARSELINKGLIYSPGRGRVDFTAPGMADYIRMVIRAEGR